MSKLSRKVSYGADFQQAKERGVEEAYQLAKAAYGPSAGNVAIETNFGYPVVSRDGVTNLRKLYLEDGDENMAARIIVQASEKSNKLVGDGTTAVVILAYHLYREAMKLIGSGHNHMNVKARLEETAKEVIESIDRLKIDTTPELSRHVAKVSASDEAIGDMVADVIDRIGIEGNIIVEEFDGIGSYDEEVNGLYFRKGFTEQFLINNINALESRMNDVDIFITDKPLKAGADIAPILEKIVQKGGVGAELMIIGEVAEEALQVLAINKAKNILFPTLVDVPVFGPMRTLFLEDLAVATGAKVFPRGAKASSFTIDMLGGAKKAIINAYSTTIIEGEGAQEDVSMRVDALRLQLKEAESLVDKEEIKKRISMLTGKISIIRVGAPTEVDRGEIQLRVEDAIAATQSAIRDGIVPGGGVALARVAPSEFREAFTAPLRELAENAGLNPSEALFKVLRDKNKWAGFDLKNIETEKIMDANEAQRKGLVNVGGKISPGFGQVTLPIELEPVDLLKVGIIDPAEVVKEAVRNAASVVGTLITMKVGITFIDREMKSD